MMNLIERDRKCIWHPYTALHSARDPIAIAKGRGAYLISESGEHYLDAVASWWVNLHGHNHPYITKGMQAQLHGLDHCIFADFTHEPAVRLAERLLALLPGDMERVFYSDNGSTAVEVALKMAWQYHQNKRRKPGKIVALSGAFHGDTFGSMSVSHRGLFNKPYNQLLFSVDFVDFPHQPDQTLNQLEKKLKNDDVSAFIVEPLVQGASGMRMYGAEVLEKMFLLCRQHGVLTIADEVMTGFGRTGNHFACDGLKTIAPDMLCLSKGLTGGVLPMGITACSEHVCAAFKGKKSSEVFYHGHSFTANPIACSAALASLDLLLSDECAHQIRQISQLQQAQRVVWEKHPKVRNVRNCGTILALELQTDEKTGYINTKRDFIYTFFIERKILLRPLGNVLYIIPPYCITNKELRYIYSQIDALLSVI